MASKARRRRLSSLIRNRGTSVRLQLEPLEERRLLTVLPPDLTEHIHQATAVAQPMLFSRVAPVDSHLADHAQTNVLVQAAHASTSDSPSSSESDGPDAKKSDPGAAQRAKEFSRPLDGPSRSASVTVGTNVLVNNPAEDTIPLQDTQSETTNLVFGSNVLVGFNDDGAYVSGVNDQFTGYSLSTDGGKTFTDQGTLPTAPGGDAGDPVMARDNVSGTVYFATLMFDPLNGYNGVQVFSSTNGGQTFQQPTNAAPGLATGDFSDKEWITVDNSAGAGQGNVYATFTDFAADGSETIYLSTSTDHGSSWTLTPIASGAVQGSDVVVGTDHSVNVFWWDGNGLNQQIMMRKSTDGGATFSPSVTVATLNTFGVNGDLGLGGFRTNAFPRVTVNPVSGALYVAYNDVGQALADRSDIYFTSSTDGGTTWAAPTKVNDDTTANDQWQPAIAVKPDGSQLFIGFYDRRNDSANYLIDTYGAVGDVDPVSGAVTFGANFKITDTSFPPAFGQDPQIASTYMGDYDTASADNVHFYYSWGDNRLSDANFLYQPDVRMATIDTGMAVTNSTPGGGNLVTGSAPQDFTIQFNDAYDPATVTATTLADFTVNGIPADSVTQTNSTTLTFHFNTSPVTSEGLQNIALAAGAVDRLSDELPLEAFSDTFRYAAVQLAETTTNPADGSVAELPLNTLQVTFNKPFDPSTLNVNNITLSQGTVTAATVDGVLPNTIDYTLSGLNNEANVTASMAAGAITETDGNPVAAFSISFITDFGTVAYPLPLTQVAPAGSGVYDPPVHGYINPIGDTDSFTINLLAGQTLTAEVHPDAAGGGLGVIEPQIILTPPSGIPMPPVTAPGVGLDAVLQAVSAATSGTYTVTVGAGLAAETGGYTLQLIVNADVQSAGNNTKATAQDITNSTLPLGGGADRLDVLGQKSNQPAYYSVSLSSGQHATVALDSQQPPPASLLGQNTTYGAGPYAEQVVYADLNGDHLPDMVVADVTGVSVRLNNGDGTFGAATEYTWPGASPFSIAVGDVTGSGVQDIVVSNHYTNGGSVTVLMGDGLGNFTVAPSSSTLVLYGGALALADLNGDGKMDVLEADAQGSRVVVGYSNGDGTFSFGGSYNVGGEAYSIAVGDMNGDGNPDIVTANLGAAYGGNGSISVLINDGKGGFAAATNYATNEDFTTGVALADLSHDGLLDVVSSQFSIYTPGSVGIWLNKGNGALGPEQTYNTGWDPISVAVGDLNGDGKPDIVVGNNLDGTVAVLSGHGDGTFNVAQNLTLPNYKTANEAPASVAIADLNGDGMPDVTAAGYDFFGGGSVEVYFNQDATEHVQLVDSSGKVLATSTAGPTNVDQVIGGFTAPATGTYYVEVTGSGGAGTQYNLVVTRGADFAQTPNNDAAHGQDITATQHVLGAIVSQSGNLNTSVSGLNDADTAFYLRPPDPTLAVGDGYVVDTVNTALRISDMKGNALLTQQFGDFFSSIPGVDDSSYLSDPQVVYDDSVNRWYVSLLWIDPNFNYTDQLFAVSNDANPLDGFTQQYRVHVSNTDFLDYDKMGFNADAVVITNNDFTGSGYGPVVESVIAIDKSALLSGTFTDYVTTFPTTADDFTMIPAQMHGSSAGDPMYFVEEDGFNNYAGNNAARVVTSTNLLSNSATFTDTNIPVNPYQAPALAAQPGGTVMTNDARFMRADWRNGVLVAAQTVSEASDGYSTARARWYEFSAPTSGTPSLLQEGTIDPGPGISTYYPSMAIDANGNIGMTYMQSSATQYASMYVTGQLATDPSGTMRPGILAAAGNSYDQTMDGYFGRAGDYSGIVADPARPATFWATNEYAGGDIWNTNVSSFTVGDNQQWFQLSANAGDPLNIDVNSLVGSGLTATLTLYDPSGAVVASGTSISVTAGMTGDYQVQVTATGGTTGEFVLNAMGATGSLPAFSVSSTNLPNGTNLQQEPQTVTVHFNQAVNFGSLASAIQVDGMPATSVTPVDGETVLVGLPQGLAEGSHTLSIAAGAVSDLLGTPIAAFSSGFALDFTPPAVIASSVAENQAMPTGNLTLTVTFSERINTALLSASDIQLQGDFLKQSYAATSYSFDPTGTVLTLNYGNPNLPVDRYTLTLAAGGFTDLAGWRLAGTGTAGTDYTVDFGLVLGTAAYPPLTAVDANGSQVYEDPSTSAAIAVAGDTDNFTLDLAAGQTVTVAVTPDANLQPSVAVLDGGGNTLGTATASAAGSQAVLETISASTAGTYTIEVSGDGGSMGAYSVQVLLNAAVETTSGGAPANTASATAQDLSSSRLSLSKAADRLAVKGTTTPGGEYYSLNLAAGQSASVGLKFQSPPPRVPLGPAATYSAGSGSYPDWVAMADLTGNGLQDMVTADYGGNDVQVRMNNGDGTFGLATDIPVPSPVAVALADVNGDGRPDIVVSTDWNVGSVVTLLNEGNGKFSAPIVSQLVAGNGAQGIALADVNGDGHLDVVQTDYFGDRAAVGLGNGKGDFTFAGSYATGSGPWSVAVGDLGNGSPDIVVANAGGNSYGTGGNISVFMNNGKGGFGSATAYDSAVGFTYGVALAHVNGDKYYDIVSTDWYYGGGGEADVWTNQGNVITGGTAGTVGAFGNRAGTVGTPDSISLGGSASPEDIEVADMNGDGIADLVVVNYLDGSVSVLTGQANLGFTVSTIAGSGYYVVAYNVALADVNGDGLPDAVTSDAETGQTSVFLNQTGQPTVQLLDANGNVLASGTGAANLDQVINNFAAQAAGTYFVRVTGTPFARDYTLVVTRNAALDTESNDTQATAQNLDGTQGAMGSIYKPSTLAAGLATDAANFSTASGGYIPPDTTVAVGDGYEVEGINTSFEFYDNTGTNVAGPGQTSPGPVPFTTFFQSLNPTGGFIFDPQIVYDDISNRWYITVLDGNSGVYTDVLFAVSKDANPLDGFTQQYRIHINSTDFFDFDKLGFNADGVFITNNDYQPSGTLVVSIISIDKSQLLSATPNLVEYLSSVDDSNFTLVPAQMHGAQPGDPMYFVTEDGWGNGSAVRVVTMTNALSNNPTFTDTNLSVAPYAEPPQAEQPGGPVNTNDTRFMRADWRNGLLVTADTVSEADDGFSTARVRWYEFNAPTSGTPSLMQEGTINPGAGVSTYYGSAALDTKGDIGLTYMESSATEFVSMYVTGRSAADAVGTMQTPTLAVAGAAFNVLMQIRAGDYSGIGVDPTEGLTFWAANEYAGNDLWNTYLDSFTIQTPPDSDWYKIDVTAANVTLNLSTSTPSAGTAAPANGLLPDLQLFDSTGNLLASGITLPDGVNQAISYVPAVTGTYYVEVSSQSGTVGGYVLQADFTPIAGATTSSTDENSPVKIDVLSQSSHTGAGALDPSSVTVVTPPQNGTTSVAADGTITYTPNTGFFGSDSFTYTVADNAGLVSNDATVSLTVSAVAAPPPLSAGNVTGSEGAAIPLDITASPASGTEEVGIAVSNVPAGITLSKGTNQGGGTWLLSLADLTGLTITAPDEETLNLLAVATGTEPSDGSTATSSATFTVSVSDATLTAGTTATLNATEGIATSGVVATFSDADAGATGADFTAAITWDNGTASTATVQSVSGGFQVVSGSHTYANEGSNLPIMVVVKDKGGSVITITGVADVADAALTGATTASATGGVEGVTPATLSGATFTDANPGAALTDFSVKAVDWGDGTSSTAGLSISQTASGFSVGGSHLYSEDGVYNFTITIHDAGGNDVTISGQTAGTTNAAFSTNVPVSTVPQTGAADNHSLSLNSSNSASFNSDFIFNAGHPDATLEFWLDPSLVSQEEDVFWTTSNNDATGGTDADNRFNLQLSPGSSGNDQLALDYREPSNFNGLHYLNPNQSAQSGLEIPADAWTFVAITRTGGDFYSYYINGTLAFSYTDANPNLPTANSASNPWTLNGRPIDRYTGLIDEVAFANQALSPSQFLDGGPAGGLPSSITNYYRFEGGSGGNLTDTINGPAKVADAPLAGNATASATGGVEGTTAATLTAATFTDANTGAASTDFSVTAVNWGDGTSGTAGLSVSGSGGNYSVGGSHLYADDGTYKFSITVKDAGGSTVTISGLTSVADAALSGVTTASASGGVEGVTPATIANATFSDANTAAAAADFSVVAANWGDGTSGTAGLSVTGSGGNYAVGGSHLYAEDGVHNFTLTVRDAGGNTATITGTADVADATLTAGTASLSADEGDSTGGVIASFTDANPGAVAADFTAQVLWGDGKASAGQVTANASGGFDVSASHAYAEEGSDTFTVVVSDKGSSTLNITGTATVADASLTPSAVTISPVEGVPWTGTFATFADANPGAAASDFSATVTWADGTTSTESVVALPSGGFNVEGTHTFSDEATGNQFTVKIVDKGTSAVSVTSTANVLDASLSGTSTPVVAVEGATFNTTIASFSDANTLATAGDYTVSIDWGDGQNTTTDYSITPTSGGGFDVVGTHAYASYGVQPITVIVQDKGGNSVTVNSTAKIADATLTAAASTTLAPVEGQTFSGTIATFTDANPGTTADDYLAMIAWGDGQTTAADSITATSGGTFAVLGSHTYNDDGAKSFSVILIDNQGGSKTTASGTLTVADATLSATAQAVAATEGITITTTLATFTDANPFATSADFTASIDWGDETPGSTGVITPAAGGGFAVIGSHAFAEPDASRVVTVTITDNGGKTAVVSLTPQVSDAPLSVTPSPITAVEGATFSGTVATFTDANPQGTAADFSAMIQWGDGQSSKADSITQTGGSFAVVASHAYAEFGAKPVSIVVSDREGSVPTTSDVTAQITDATLSAKPAPISSTEGGTFSGTVATFTDANPQATAADYTVAIDWGDGHTTGADSITAMATGGFAVVASHSYAEFGTEAVSVVITDREGSSPTTSDVTAQIADATLSAKLGSLSPVEGITISGVVATFTDANPRGAVADYTATVVWGDGKTTAADAITAVAGGGFAVVASHVYADDGDLPVSVLIGDTGGQTATASGTLSVADASLTSFATSIAAVEGNAYTGPLASFVDANPGATKSDFSAVITFADGTTATGTIVPLATGGFNVVGSHTFGDEAPTESFTVAITDRGGSTTHITSTAAVSDAPLAGQTAAIAAIEGATFSGTVATFTDGNPLATAAGYTATIDWGDGHTTTADSVTAAAGGGFAVIGSHVFADEGSSSVTVVIQDKGGNVATVVSGAVVADATLSATASASISSVEGATFSGAVATFTDANPAATSSDYTAAIDWGDGKTTSGEVTVAAGGGFAVVGSHLFNDEGKPSVTVVIHDKGGATASVVGTAVVGDASLSATASSLASVEGSTFSGALATFTDANPAAAVSDFKATIAWGDGKTTTGAVTTAANGGFAVAGVHVFADEQTQPVVVTITDIGGATAVATVTTAVADAAVHLTAAAVTIPISGALNNMLLATFTDDGGAAPPSNYAATIDWGDGSTGAGTVGVSNGQLAITGSHTYPSAQAETIRVTLNDLGGANDAVKIQASPQLSGNQAYIAAVYQDVLGRAPTAAELSAEATALDNGQTRLSVVHPITHGAEYYQTMVITPAYQKYLGRTPDAAGLAFWTDQLQNHGLTDEALEAGFIGSAEFYANAGGTDKGWVDALYQSLLGRPADSAGESFWLQALAGGESRSDVAYGFTSSLERETTRIQGDYVHYLGRTADQSGVTYWVAQFASGVTNEDLITGFAISDEYYSKHTGG